MSARDVLLAALIGLRAELEDGTYSGDWGICRAVELHVIKDSSLTGDGKDYVHELKAQLMQSWPLYSGNSTYPVPAPESFEAGDVYLLDDEGEPTDEYREADEMERAEECFDSEGGSLEGEGYWSGDYGALRRNLLDYMIGQLTKPE